ncbi:DEAD/DEAH box helicase family protein [Carbonactinospora thermoautotrophica]|uniref:DEAD/DEAH box helicase family protein n=1 Tax=Carbonactinospora thermoautotrophica TaxID=1469144 RepID=UPI0013015408|nr:SNF2-related protein [Carbonactinospora thermoautotrophica]
MRANLAALRTLRTLQAENRPATPGEQAVLARWSGWGAVPQVFDESNATFAWAREELGRLLSPREYAAARRNTLNAHYTAADLVRAIWDGVARLGFTGGSVLEPGCGSGNFIGFAPSTARVVGVEVEPVTAGIAAALYPDAQIICESFADTKVAGGAFDLVIGNVPFGKVSLTDREHNPNGHSIHNHFILKGLRLLRPGGLLAVLTSYYTLDAADSAARREMAALADLVGAVRLPSEAHREAAGTDAVTDLIILRRREEGRLPADGVAWQQVRTVDVPGGQIQINEYFLAHPEAVLGELDIGRGLYRADELVVRATGPVAPALAEALEQVVARARERGLTLSPRPAEVPEPVVVPAADREAVPDGFLQAHPDGTFTRRVGGRPEPYEVPASQAEELRRLLGLRDTVRALLAAEAASAEDTPQIARLRAELNARYDAYVARFGPINRFSWRRTGRRDEETGEEKMARVRPPQGGFRTDPFAPTVYALDSFDPITGTAAKATIFTQRVIAPRAPRTRAETPADALAICLDTYGEVRLPEIARLLGVDESTAREQLGTLVFDEPGTGRLVPRAEYLSGNVRAKLAEAQAWAAVDSRYAPNVDALREVIPPDLTPEEITARLGATWIDATYVEQFLQEILEDPTVEVEHPGGAVWTVRGGRNGVLARETWGTPRVPAPALAQALLEQRPIRVYDKQPDGSQVFNPEATEAAQAKAQELNQRFSEWVWEDPQRAAELARVYNERFNAIVLRTYDGSELSLPGLAAHFTPRPHQRAAVARIINEPAVLLAHEVGAGKTAEMVMGAMELRRLGLARKPAIIVPNHMLEQVSREFLELYPQARILVATKEDLTRDRRREFVARCASGDWDAVVMTHSSFERIGMSKEAQEAYLRREIKAFEEMLERSRADRGLTVKRMEAALARAEESLKKKLDKIKDVGVTFEATGIDYLFVDEAHLFKNLRNPSNIPEMQIEGSGRASDLDMKIDYLRRRNGRRVVTFATATPIANSMAEAYVMQKYLRPDLLADAGFDYFDSWAATFGEIVTQIEVAPAGGFRLHSRFAKFSNVPELLRMFHVVADIKTADDLNLPRPALAGDGPETVVVEPSPELLEFVAELGRRAEQVRGRRPLAGDDNMLKITTEGRLAALDLRLVGRDSSTPSKIDVAADKIAEIWAAHRDDVYHGPDGQPEPIRGSLQIVFCDLGTPKDDSDWNVYDELRDQLVARGLPRESIRFVHEAKNDREKGELFAACRAGRVAVLIGSTERMGVGTNVQRRAVALHHLDCPWRPADLAQRDGRILRQGNANREVRIIRYVTERSFDAYLWQTIERKARFISQVMRGRLDVREIEDISDTALDANVVKALATGDPLVLEHAEATEQVARLERLERAWRRSQESLRWTISSNEAEVTRLTAEIEAIDAALARRQDTRGDAFAMRLEGATFTKRAEAGERLIAIITRETAGVLEPGTSRDPVEIGSLGGFPVTLTARRTTDGIVVAVLRLEGVPESETWFERRELRELDRVGAIQRLENRLFALERRRTQAQTRIEQLWGETQRAQQNLGKPFAQAEQLAAARARLQRITEAMGKQAKPEVGQAGNAGDSDLVAAAIHDAAAMAGIVPGAPGVTVQTGSGTVSDFLEAVSQAASASQKEADRPADATPGEPTPGPYRSRAESRAGEETIRQAFERWRELVPDPATPAERTLVETGTTVLEEAARRRRERLARGRDEDADLDVGLYRALRTAAHALAQQADQPQDRIDAATRIAEATDTHIKRTDATLADVDSYVQWARSPEPPLDAPASIFEIPATAPATPARDTDSEVTDASRPQDTTGVDAPHAGEPTPAGEALAITDAEQSTEPRPESSAPTPVQAAPEPPAAVVEEPDAASPALIEVHVDGRTYQLQTTTDGTRQVVFDGETALGSVRETDDGWVPAAYGTVRLPQHPRPTRDEAVADLVHATRPQAAASPAEQRERIIDQAEREDPRPREEQPAEQETPQAEPDPQDAAPLIVIEHHQDGTLVHGTTRNDIEVRRALATHGFKWSRRLNAWYLPRTWRVDTRAWRVVQLRRELDRLGRQYTVQTEPAVPEAQPSRAAPEPHRASADRIDQQAAAPPDEPQDPASAEATRSDAVSAPEPEQAEPAEPYRSSEDLLAGEDAVQQSVWFWQQTATDRALTAPADSLSPEERISPWRLEREKLHSNWSWVERYISPATRGTHRDLIGSYTRLAACAERLARAVDEADRWVDPADRQILHAVIDRARQHAARLQATIDRADEVAAHLAATRAAARAKVAAEYGYEVSPAQEQPQLDAPGHEDRTLEQNQPEHEPDHGTPASTPASETTEENRQESLFDLESGSEPATADTAPAQHEQPIDAVSAEPTPDAGADLSPASAPGNHDQDQADVTVPQGGAADELRADRLDMEERATTDAGERSALDSGTPDFPSEADTGPAAEATPDETPQSRDADDPQPALLSGRGSEEQQAVPDPPPGPLTEADIRHVLGQVINPDDLVMLAQALGDRDAERRWISAMAGRLLGWYTWRGEDEPDPGAREETETSRRGVRHRVYASPGPREGLIPWTEVVARLRTGLTRDRIRALFEAHIAYLDHQDDWAMALEEPDAWTRIDRQLEAARSEAARAILDASTAPPPGRRSRTSPRSAGPDAETLFADESEPVTLPPRPPRPRKALPQLQPGDILPHPGYGFGPFTVRQIHWHPDHVRLEGDVRYGSTPPWHVRPRRVTFNIHFQGDPQETTVELAPVSRRRAAEPVPQTTAAQLEAGTEAQAQASLAGEAALDDPTPGQDVAEAEDATVPSLNGPSNAERVSDDGAARPEHAQDDERADAAVPALTESVPEPEQGVTSTEPAAATASPAEAATAEPSPQTPVESDMELEPQTTGEELAPEVNVSDAVPTEVRLLEIGDWIRDDRGRARRVVDIEVGEAPGAGMGLYLEPNDGIPTPWWFWSSRDRVLRLARPLDEDAVERPAQHGLEAPVKVPAPGADQGEEVTVGGDEPDRQDQDDPLDQAFAGVVAALREHAAPPADAQDQDAPAATFEEVLAALRRLQGELASAVPDHEAAIPAQSATVATDPGMAHALHEVDDAYDQAASQIGRYVDAPEWQRIQAIRDAARHLWATIRDAAGSYYREIAADVRVRGFYTTVAARSSRAISHLAWRLAARMSRDGQRDTLAWRAVRRLHHAADRYATRLLFRADLDRFEDVVGALRSLRDGLQETAPRAEPARSGLRGAAGAVGDSLRRLQDAYTTARTRITATLGPEWDRITALWREASGLWDAGGRPFARTVLARTCDLIEDLSDDMAASLALNRQRNTRTWRALIRLSRAAEDLGARLRGYLQPGKWLDQDAAETDRQVQRPANALDPHPQAQAATTTPAGAEPAADQVPQVSYVYAHQGVTARARHGSTVVQIGDQHHPVTAPINSLDAFSTQLVAVVRNARPVQQEPRAYWLHYQAGSVTVAYQGGETAYLRDGKHSRWQRITVPITDLDAAAFAAAARAAIATRPHTTGGLIPYGEPARPVLPAQAPARAAAPPSQPIPPARRPDRGSALGR